ncbi:hypothetical protein NDU88_005838 [Pleurodeles waltl]|uniref:ribonuclease H n=1 Tax=Pleurodeles waltl TaxID=8319 RepID=A0AAV7UJV6_PLEWA|nr:hypothetical protein NDU88_005838 [Pleurodeles waltl]
MKVKVNNVYSKGVQSDDVDDCANNLSNVVLTVDITTVRNIKGPICQAVIDSVELSVMADSGSPVTIIADVTYRRYWPITKVLNDAHISPKAFGDHDIELLGYFLSSLSILGRSTMTKIYAAVDGRDIIGWKDLAKLGIVLRPGFDNSIILGEMPIEVSEISLPVTNISESFTKKYPEVFANVIGVVQGFEHCIRLKDGAVPVSHKVRPIPISVKGQLKDLLEKLVKDGIITPTDSSEWVSPIVLTKKTNADLRLCVALRSLNKNIIIDCHPLPRIQEMIASLGTSKIFSTIDLHSAYHQIALRLDSQELTSFVTPFGAYKYLRLPFGLASAASIFQKLMDSLFGDFENVCAFQDDILFHTKDMEEHFVVLDKVFSILKDCGITIKSEKCKFLVQSVEYLGHSISSDGIKPEQGNVEATSNAPCPWNKDELRSFLGLCEYYSRFVDGYAMLVQSLRNLLKKGSKFEWGEQVMAAFNAIKNLVLSAPALKPFIPSAKSFPAVDASMKGLGAVFGQWVGGQERTIAFASRSLSEAEINYSTIEREALACVWAVYKFKTYIWGMACTLFTDHKPLVFLMDGNGLGVNVEELKQKVSEKQFIQKRDYDSRKNVSEVMVNGNDWVLIKKPCRVSKGASRYSLPVKVVRVSKSAVLLKGKGWWNKNSIIPISSSQADIFKQVYAGREDEDDTSSSAAFIDSSTKDKMSNHALNDSNCQARTSCHSLEREDDPDSSSSSLLCPAPEPLRSRSHRLVKLPSKYNDYLLK